jgi:hypothetical protein
MLQIKNNADTLFFEFLKNKHCLVITNISDTSNMVSINKGDTLARYQKDIVLFNIQKKLVFQRGNKKIYTLSGKKFVFKSKRRTLELKFVNDSIATLTNIFHCPDIEPEYKIIVQQCKYTHIGNEIYLKNEDPKFGDRLYIEIPPQNSNICDFLNENKRQHPSFAPNYATDYEKYGIVLNITIDTIHIFENK